MRGERQLTRLGAPFHRPVGLIRHLPDGTRFGTRIAANIAKLPELLRRSRLSSGMSGIRGKPEVTGARVE